MRKNTNYENSNCAIILCTYICWMLMKLFHSAAHVLIVIHLTEMICISCFLVLLLFNWIKLILETYNEQNKHVWMYLYIHICLMIISGNRKKAKTTKVFTSVLSTKCLHYVNKQKHNWIQCMDIHNFMYICIRI